MKVVDQDLVIATMGRSFWILDDLSVLRQIDDKVSNSKYHLHKPSATERVSARGFGGADGLGKNPPKRSFFTLLMSYIKIENK